MSDVSTVIINFVFFAIAGYQIYKLAKVHPLSPTDFPQIPSDKFNEWKKLELQSVYSFLISTGFFWILSNIVLKDLPIIFFILPSLTFLGGIILAILDAIKAKKIKDSFQMDWKKRVKK